MDALCTFCPQRAPPPLERKIAMDCMTRLLQYKTILALLILAAIFHSNAVCLGEDAKQLTLLDLEALQIKIVESLGLQSAIISVGLEQTSTGDLFIPWRNNEQPTVKVALPQSWITKRSEQVGSEETALASLRAIIERVAPGSKVAFQVVHDVPVSTPAQVNQESFVKPIAMSVGLVAILLSGLYYDRRRTAKDVVVVQHAVSANVEAARILNLQFYAAKNAMDALNGVHRKEVLQAIAGSVRRIEENPVVQVQQQREPAKST